MMTKENSDAQWKYDLLKWSLFNRPLVPLWWWKNDDKKIKNQIMLYLFVRCGDNLIFIVNLAEAK